MFVCARVELRICVCVVYDVCTTVNDFVWCCSMSVCMICVRCAYVFVCVICVCVVDELSMCVRGICVWFVDD